MRVRNGVAMSLQCDKALMSVFGSAAQHTENEVLRHLDSYVADLASRVCPDWLGRV